MKASRTLVKSGPELWAECSDAASLSRHLGAFGEIRITRLEPETAVAWEGDAASGTVRLEPSGWGTRVVLTATASNAKAAGQAPADPDAATEAEPNRPADAATDPPSLAQPEPEPVRDVETPAPGPFARLLGLLGWRRRSATRSDSPAMEPAAETAAAPEPVEAAEPVEPPRAASTPNPQRGPVTAESLDDALDSLGRAHHRPYSRT